MVPKVLTAWRWQRGPGGLAMYPRDGSSSTILIRTRITPLRTAPEIAKLVVEELGLETPQRVLPPEPFATVEGEYGAFVELAGTSKDGRPIDVPLAILFGDDWYTYIAGVASPEHAVGVRATVRELAQTYSLGLGTIRRRRYRYDAPPGWSAQTRDLVTEWQAPHGSAICVFPARPLVETAAGAIDRALHELVIDGFVATGEQTVPLKTARFASGIARFVTGKRGDQVVHHDVAVLLDERFFYVCRLETSPAKLSVDRDVFAALVESIAPLPSPRPPAALDSALTASWVD